MNDSRLKKKRGKIRRSSDFSLVFKGGRRGSARGISIVILETGRPRRVGYSVSRKIGDAVRRNRVRRLLREAYRLNEARMVEGYDVVVVARPEIIGKPFHEVERAFIKASIRAGIMEE